MRAMPHTNGAREDGPSWVSYRCKAAGVNRDCSVQYSVQQRRLHALIGYGLQCAFESFGVPLPSEGDGPPGAQSPIQSPIGDGMAAPSGVGVASSPAAAVAAATAAAATASLARQEALVCLDRKRARYLELFACGLIRDKTELESHLTQVAQERQALEHPRVHERLTSSAATRVVSLPEAARLQAEFVARWPPDWERLLDVSKHELLESLRAVIFVRILPHQAKEPSKTGNNRHNGGRLTVTLELSAFGFVGTRALQLAETDEQLKQYWRWRGSFLHLAH